MSERLGITKDPRIIATLSLILFVGVFLVAFFWPPSSVGQQTKEVKLAGEEAPFVGSVELTSPSGATLIGAEQSCSCMSVDPIYSQLSRTEPTTVNISSDRPLKSGAFVKFFHDDGQTVVFNVSTPAGSV